MTTYRSKKYRGAKSEIQATTGVGDICDITLTSLATDEILCYNGTNWVNATASSGGGATSLNGLSDAIYDTDHNLGLGSGATDAITTGTDNIGIGENAATAITTGTDNIGIGYNALSAATTQGSNIAIGSQAGESTTQYHNVFIGVTAGRDNTTGQSNTAVGSQALRTNITGQNNVAVGRSALLVNTGTGSTALGYQALVTSTCSNNTAVGVSAMSNLTTGQNNVAIGRASGQQATTGSNNIFIGYNSQPSSATVSNEITLGDANITSLRIPGLQSSATDGQVLTYCSTNGNIVLKDAGGGGGSICCFSYNSGSSALVATADLTSTCSALFGDVLISGNTITPDDSNTVTCLGSDGTLNISGNLSVQGDFLKLPLTDACSCCCAPTGGCETTSIGAMRYNTTTNTVQVHNGTEFTGIGLDGISDGTNGQVLTTDGAGNFTFQSVGGADPITSSLDVNSPKTIKLNADYGGGSGNNNTVMGGNAFTSSPTGGQNTIIGSDAGTGSGSGSRTTIVGACSGRGSGSANTIVGAEALMNNIYGQNVAVGAFAGGNGTLVQCTVLVGYQSGQCLNNWTSDNNTFVGHQAGRNTTTGSKNTRIGSCPGGLGTGSNNTVIGYNATASSTSVSNQITLGNSSITSLRANVTSISSLSDQRDKTNICDLSVGLCFVDELKPVTFDWNRRDGTMSGQKDVGFIAQDLDSLQQKYNIEDHLNIVLKSNPDRLETSPGKLIPILVKAIQELTKKVEELENKIGK